MRVKPRYLPTLEEIETAKQEILDERLGKGNRMTAEDDGLRSYRPVEVRLHRIHCAVPPQIDWGH